MKKFVNGERFLLLLIVLISIILSSTKLLVPVNNLIYDSLHPYLAKKPNSEIAIIAIDNKSIDALGRWPWPRSTHAKLLEKIEASQAQAVIFSVLFSEEESNPLLFELNRIRNRLEDKRILSKDNVNYQAGSAWLNESEFTNQNTLNKYLDTREYIISTLASINQDIDNAILRFDGDRALSDKISDAPPVIMPIRFDTKDRSRNAQTTLLPDYIKNSAASYFVNGDYSNRKNILPPSVGRAHYPISIFGEHLNSVGHVNIFNDADGTLRSMNILLNQNNTLYPSIALSALALSHGISPNKILYHPGIGVNIGSTFYFTDENLNILPHFYFDKTGEPSFSIDSYVDVLNSNNSNIKYKDKIVLIGVTADGLGTRVTTPTGQSISSVELSAHAIADLLDGHYFYNAPWAKLLNWVLFFVFFSTIFLWINKIRLKQWMLITGVSVGVIISLQTYLLAVFQLWLPLAMPLVFIVFSFIVINIWRYRTSESQSILAMHESSENNFALGLTYQTQGQFDLALDKFNRCEKNDRLAEALYSLGLDFERKRMPHKAHLVYTYIQAFRENFYDIDQRLKTLSTIDKDMSTAFSADSDTATIKIEREATLENPTFGRYIIEKEIGRGGMGTVYLGFDPKIDRKVAIKTLDFSNSNLEHVEETKKLFFIEAKAAGRIEHKNIVTLFDVGEEHDLAYIAMAYLPGKDLGHYTNKESLLPLRDVINIGIACADALEFAHKSSTVHRDIKPQNIIYDKKTKTPWITDFGIALLINTDMTRQGETLGSPSYMSPEQIRGDVLDGRSDIYSLGVTLFQLIAACKPFSNTDVSALIYQIVHDAIPSLIQLNSEIPVEISDVIFKAMQKDRSQRYQSAGEMRDALQDIVDRMS